MEEPWPMQRTQSGAGCRSSTVTHTESAVSKATLRSAVPWPSNSVYGSSVPDRPGMGRSDFQPGRRIVDWPNDVLELATALGFDTFAVLGSSGGARWTQPPVGC